MAAGNISRDAGVSSTAIAGRADLCVHARTHLFDLYWTRHIATEQGRELPWPPVQLACRLPAPLAAVCETPAISAGAAPDAHDMLRVLNY